MSDDTQEDALSASPRTWRDFLEDPDPFVAAMAQEMKKTPANIHSGNIIYSVSSSQQYYYYIADTNLLQKHGEFTG